LHLGPPVENPQLLHGAKMNELNKQTVKGSLLSQAANNQRSLAETFISADVIVLVDTSGSMGASDNTERTRYERACDELEKVQASMPGKIAVISFSDDVMFCPGGVPWNYSCGTDLTKALKFSKVADVEDMRFIVISDGKPDNETTALQIAKSYKNKIDTIYIGPGDESNFLERLSSISGGKSANDFSAHKLEQTIYGLLS
jgi:Mg-chelatase subunit ChlD